MSTPIYTNLPANNTSATSPNYSYNVTAPLTYGNITISAGGGITGTSCPSAGSYTIAASSAASSFGYPNSSNLTVSGDAEISGNIHMGGKNLAEVLSSIEYRLAILRPNPALEEEYGELKELGEKYRVLEKQLMEKQRTFDILKKQ